MIIFKDIVKQTPFNNFYKLYCDAVKSKQKSIEAMAISSYNNELSQVDSRFVNAKYLLEDKIIFFSNYNSNKATQFDGHPQASVLFYWGKIGTQIRMKGIIKKTDKIFNATYFANRDIRKNALAISSSQSKVIQSFEMVKSKYEGTLNNKNLSDCPDYWGGYAFKPYEIEFWNGSEFSLNRRDLYKKNKSKWDHSILEP